MTARSDRNFANPQIQYSESDGRNGDDKPSVADASLAPDVTSGSRTPRPYYHDRHDIHQDASVPRMGSDRTVEDGRQDRHLDDSTVASPAPGSESGSEADDERPPSFVKALPAPAIRPRKGLKVGETSEEALLTPSQLDDQGRRLDYFRKRDIKSGVALPTKEHERTRSADLKFLEQEEEKLLRRRLAEFARRISEVALVALIVMSVLCGRGVARMAVSVHREIFVHLLVVVVLVLAYPLKLSILDTRTTRRRLWERFRVPASFDPATVLYPPFLPLLVALIVSPANPATLLPNIILGLASLPQRLFPRSSRLGGLNSVHWLVSTLPLLAVQESRRSTECSPSNSSLLSDGLPCGLSIETLVSLYPLHHTLLHPLQYLTTTSLLMSELHLLSVSLINLLLLASSPQAVILKACLWTGGVTLFVCAAPVLHWNVTLARVPKWKLRRPGHSSEERKSLVDAVTELIDLQRAASVLTSHAGTVESDADEDAPKDSLTVQSNGRPRTHTAHTLSASRREFHLKLDPPHGSGHQPHQSHPSNTIQNGRPRSSTMPDPESTAVSVPRRDSRKSRVKSHSLLWCLRLTPEQAGRRKWLYAAHVYLAVIVIVLGPIRFYVDRKALFGHDPFGWAVGYLLGQLEPIRALVDLIGLESWAQLPSPPLCWTDSDSLLPLNVPVLRSALGASNTRLLLIGYWAVVFLIGLLAVFSLTAYVEVDTRRKIFHGVMVAMFLPATFVDPCFCALALALVLTLFLLLEVLRAGLVPPLGSAIGRFVAPYIDGRDLRGPVVVSHIFLLIGCAVPLWFSLASLPREREDTTSPWKGWDIVDDSREVAMLAGVVCVGLGDAAASLIGRRYGRHKWIWVGGKSLEGSAAFAIAVVVGLSLAKLWLLGGGWRDVGMAVSSPRAPLFGSCDLTLGWLASATWWFTRALFCACATSFMEAVLTGANDNVVVPVALWLLVRGARL